MDDSIPRIPRKHKLHVGINPHWRNAPRHQKWLFYKWRCTSPVMLIVGYGANGQEAIGNFFLAHKESRKRQTDFDAYLKPRILTSFYDSQIMRCESVARITMPDDRRPIDFDGMNPFDNSPA